ncbi:L-threonine 3-dehydrogenase [Serratia liquefaciens]|nr:L-threonine 3-dehydrogenase [Serratia liquefaciens]
MGVNRPGCFAEYLVIPAFNAFKIPTISLMTWRLSSTRSATRCTPRSPSIWSGKTCWFPARSDRRDGGGVAKHVGARNVVITDVNEYRLELARKMGVTRAVNVAKENLNDVMAELG